MSELPRSTISAFVICCNEEQRIRRCLESLAWCDELVVVDSGSSDRTLEICRTFTSRIIERPWPGFVAQKRFALGQCNSDWVLNIDADEEVSPELKAEVQAVLERDKAGSIPQNGFMLPRTVFYMGKWWRRGGWYPEFRLRLCRRSSTSWGGDDPHERALVQGSVGKLSGELHHYTYRDLADQVRSIGSLSKAAARTMYEKGRRASLVDLVGRPIARFIKFYILKRGFLEGMSGFIVAIMDAWGVFLKYAKLWELQRNQNTHE